MSYTTEQIIQFIEDAGEVRVAAAMATLGYLVQPFTDTPLADAEHIVLGTVRVLDAHGVPVHGLRVKVETVPTALAVTVDGAQYHVAAADSTRWFATDALGVCAVPFVKGARVTVHVEGTLARSFVVPQLPFDILSFPSDDTDAFITPRKPYAPLIRNS